jgi:hypothetical protein
MTQARQSSFIRLLNINLVMSLGTGAFCYLWFLWLRAPLYLFWDEGLRLLLLLTAFLTISTIYLKSYILQHDPDATRLLTRLISILVILYLAGTAGLALPQQSGMTWTVSAVGLGSILYFIYQFNRGNTKSRPYGAIVRARALGFALALLVVAISLVDGLLLQTSVQGSLWWDMQHLPWWYSSKIQWPALAFWVLAVSVPLIWFLYRNQNVTFLSDLAVGYFSLLLVILISGFFIGSAAVFKAEIPWSYEAQRALFSHMDSAYHLALTRGFSEVGYPTTGLDGEVFVPYHFAAHLFIAGLARIAGIDYYSLLTLVQYIFMFPFLFWAVSNLVMIIPLNRLIREDYSKFPVLILFMIAAAVPAFYFYGGPQMLRSIPTTLGFIILIAGFAILFEVWFEEQEMNWGIIGLLLVCIVLATYSKVSFGYLLAAMGGWVVLRKTGFSKMCWIYTLLAITILLSSYSMFLIDPRNATEFPLMHGFKHWIIEPPGQMNLMYLGIILLVYLAARFWSGTWSKGLMPGRSLEFYGMTVLFPLIPIMVVNLILADIQYFLRPASYVAVFLFVNRAITWLTVHRVAIKRHTERMTSNWFWIVVACVILVSGQVSLIIQPLQFPMQFVQGAGNFNNDTKQIVAPEHVNLFPSSYGVTKVLDTLNKSGMFISDEMKEIYADTELVRITDAVNAEVTRLESEGYDRQKLTLFIPREITPAKFIEKGRNTRNNTPCKKFGPQLYSWTGVPQIFGIALGVEDGLCPQDVLRNYGYDNYDFINGRSLSTDDGTPERLCGRSLEKEYEIVIMFEQINPEVRYSILKCNDS